MKWQLALAGVACAVLALAVAAATAQLPTTGMEKIEGITVFGTGEVRARPNLIEIDLQNSGAAELSGDAIVKYRDNKKRMLEAFESLKLKNLAIVEKGVSLSAAINAAEIEQAMRFGQAAPTKEKAQMMVTRTLRLTLSDVQDMPEEELMETLGKIFDVAKDAGIALAASPEAQAMAMRYGRSMSGATPSFVLDNITDLREKAYEKAVEDARTRAQRLAAYHKLKLGDVVGVQEVMVSGDEGAIQQQYAYYYGYPVQQTASDAPGPRVTSPTFGELPVRVKLAVRFAIAK